MYNRNNTGPNAAIFIGEETQLWYKKCECLCGQSQDVAGVLFLRFGASAECRCRC